MVFGLVFFAVWVIIPVGGLISILLGYRNHERFSAVGAIWHEAWPVALVVSIIGLVLAIAVLDDLNMVGDAQTWFIFLFVALGLLAAQAAAAFIGWLIKEVKRPTGEKPW